MTVVGDVNQTGSPAGVTDWAALFDDLAPDRWSMELLTVNYRTPRPVMELAVEHLRSVGIPAPEVTSARDGAEPVRTTVDGLASLPDLVGSELRLVGAGRIAVISSSEDQSDVGAALAVALPDVVGMGDDAVDSQVAVLTPALSKGLEFDVVVVVDPRAIARAPGSGARDLYVAYTRTTSRLVLVDVGAPR
jgi:DNA helicase IV